MSEFDKDSYRTPSYIVNWAKKAFSVNVDGCATFNNKICERYIGQGGSMGADFLKFEFNLAQNTTLGKPRFWVNPPYSNPKPFIERSIELMQQGYFVVMLLPADKSTKWYQLIQDNATEVIDIVGGRINFLHPVTGEEVKGNNKGSILAVFDPNMQGFVTRQISLDFIKERGGY